VTWLLSLAGLLPLLCAASCARQGKVAGVWRAAQIGSGQRWTPVRPSRQEFLTLGADGKGRLVMHTAIGVKQFGLSWEARGSNVTVRMQGQVYSTGTLGAEGKSLLTTDIGGTQTQWVRTRG
jgi:hypothetical protein